MIPKDYNNTFFKSQQSQSYMGAKKVLPIIKEWIKPNSVVDIGCGVGAWLKAFKELGVNNVKGLDGSYVDTKNLVIDTTEFIVADLEKNIQLKDKYDLAMCLEVAEHLTPERANSFVADLCNSSDVILFSAAVPGQEGTLHINEQYPIFWKNIFEQKNYECIDCIRPIIWNDEEIEFWYKQNMMLFINKEKINNYLFLKQLPSYNGNSLLHPNLFDYKTNRGNSYKKTLDNPFRVLNYYLKSVFGTAKK